MLPPLSGALGGASLALAGAHGKVYVIYSFIRPYMHSLIQDFICSFIRSFINLLISIAGLTQKLHRILRGRCTASMTS